MRSTSIFFSCVGVSPPACTSPESGTVILPSGRTTAVHVQSISRQVLMNRTSSGPIKYLLGSTAEPMVSVFVLLGLGGAGLCGLTTDGGVWPAAPRLPNAARPAKTTDTKRAHFTLRMLLVL